jgi:Na+-translocating ferredoxin:NAD+ oxidoreductase RnfG subunit
MNSLFRSIGFLLGLFSLILTSVSAQEVYVCVWRNPERTMTRIFPEARDYKTISKDISPQKLEIIEKRLGSRLLPGQRETYQYYELVDTKGSLLGYIIAAAQRGEFGVIEFVFGLDLDIKINGIYIQRARERDREFSKREFLEQFIGKGIEDVDKMEISKDKTIKKTIGTTAVILGIREELITFDELVLSKEKIEEIK